MCRRKPLFQHTTPFLQRYGTLWIYSFTRQHQITLRCTKADTQVPRTLTLEGIGLHNLSGCHISSPELHAFPKLNGTTYAKTRRSNILPARQHLCTQQSWTPPAKGYTTAESSKIRWCIQPSHSLLTLVRFGLTSAYSPDFASSRRTNELVYNPSYLAYHCCSFGIPIYFFYTRYRNTYCITRKANATTSTTKTSVEPNTAHNENSEPGILVASYSLQQTN